MRVSLRWLRDYVQTDMAPDELARRLTEAGLEVSDIEEMGRDWDGIFVAHVVSVEPHPRADRLLVARAEAGDRRFTLVTGAPNITAGVKVPLAVPGAHVHDPETGEPVTVAQRALRGVTSEAVLCSESELGISDDHTGIMLLPDDAPVGAPLADYLGDTFLDCEVTPNRPDWLSMLGIAWEVGAVSGQRVNPPDISYPEAGRPIADEVSVEIADPDLGLRYAAALVRGVTVAPSPYWLQQRLLAAGMRPINNVVDVTNYVMLEYGQPLHAFDVSTLRGRRIIVRRARQGEVMRSLDGMERQLTTDALVIADAERAVAIAGVMGGVDTEVTPLSRDILLESAAFLGASIRRTARRLGLRTEASLRFERNLSPELPIPALCRAAQLLAMLAGGAVAPGLIDVYPARRPIVSLSLTSEATRQLLGVEIPLQRTATTLANLGFVVQMQRESVQVTVPFWRSDIAEQADLIEEVARIEGYSGLPESLAVGRLSGLPAGDLWSFKDRLRDLLAAAGLQEVITYSLVSHREAEEGLGESALLRTVNPLSPDREYLRTSLRPGVFRVLASNQRRDPDEGLRLFELGRVYRPQEGPLPQEREMAVGVLSGPRAARSWPRDASPLDFYDAKGALEALAAGLGVAFDLTVQEGPGLRPGRAARLSVGAIEVGWLGELHPRAAEEHDLTQYPAVLLELDVEALASIHTSVRVKPLPRYPGASRDLAVVVDDAGPSAEIEALLRQGPLVADVGLFDVYTGPPVPPGKRSLAYRLLFQAPDRTLTDEEVEAARAELVDRLHISLGAILRE